MKLLEQYHERLAGLIKWQRTHPVPQSSEAVGDDKPTLQSASDTAPSESQQSSAHRPHQQSKPTALPQRDVSSSIASNLASARGIPPNRQRRGSPASPASSIQHAEGKLTTPQRRSKLGDYPSRAAPNPIQEKVTSSTNPSKAIQNTRSLSSANQSIKSPVSTTDEPFNRFYNTFENLFSKLSAPLAFAGLPLGSESTTTQQTTVSNNPVPVNEKAKDDPDYTRAFSRAALRALHEERGLPTAAESFYVVPTTGGVSSYRDILTRSKRDAAQRLGLPEPTESELANDEFVDARETPQPPSPTTDRKGVKVQQGLGSNTKTMEELTLENQAMRDLLDVMSKRLAQFEMGSQSQSMALHQSLRLMQQSQALPPLPTVGDTSKSLERNAANDEKLAAVEEQLGSVNKELERMGRENEKLKGVIGRYRERWEKLKEGARTRRGGTSTQGEG